MNTGAVTIVGAFAIGGLLYWKLRATIVADTYEGVVSRKESCLDPSIYTDQMPDTSYSLVCTLKDGSSKVVYVDKSVLDQFSEGDKIAKRAGARYPQRG